MRGFQENNCRLCPKVFCCKNCRLKHEKNVHKVFPDCDICIYGQLILENIDDCFLKHLESSHLPLHCNYCRKIFSSIEDLLQHIKCTFSHIKERSPNPKTPFKTPPAILVDADDQDSPILQDLQRQELLNYILATSTPMHRGEEPNLFEKSKQEAITPVDKPLKASNKSIIKKTDLKSDGQFSKRRVTFGGTSTSFSDRKLDESKTEDQENIPASGNTVKLLDAQPPLLDQKPNNETTPVTGVGSDQFYSAKTETAQFFSAKTDISSQSTRESNKARNMEEGCTPVGIPNKSKLNNAKGNIYNKHEQQNLDILGKPMSGAVDNTKSQDNLSKVSIDVCTTPGPAKSLNASEDKDKSNVSNHAKSQDNFSKVYIERCTPGPAKRLNASEDMNKSNVSDQTKNQNDLSKFSIELTAPGPGRTTNPGKIVKGDIYKNTPFRATISIKSKDNDSTDRENELEDKPKTKEMLNEKSSHAGHDTVWLSATNIDESNQSKSLFSGNMSSFEEIKPHQEKRSPPDTTESPKRTNVRRLSIVIPTPILKTTSVQMKFNIPAHLSSTPIMSEGLVNFQQTKIVQDISSRILQQQTPFKTPQGKLCDFVQRKLVDNKLRRNLAPLSVVEPGPSIEEKEVFLKNITGDHSREAEICTDVVPDDDSSTEDEDEYQESFSSISEGESGTGISVSSMTESSLWSSMTKMVRSVFGGLTNIGQDNINDMSQSNNISFKRARMGDSTEEPRLKRFKFTDIKCRRAIRDLPVITFYNQPSTVAPIASIEIKKSVSTVYGQQTIRIQCDKATQTDNYSMYG